MFFLVDFGRLGMMLVCLLFLGCFGRVFGGRKHQKRYLLAESSC